MIIVWFFKWALSKLGDGWLIRNLRYNNYLTIEGVATFENPIVGNKFPVTWSIQPFGSKNDKTFQ